VSELTKGIRQLVSEYDASMSDVRRQLAQRLEDQQRIVAILEEHEQKLTYAPPVTERRVQLARNIAAWAGLGLVGGGCWWIYPPYGLLAVGAVLLAAVSVGTAVRITMTLRGAK
jgi:hypothetical protein